MTVSPVVTQFTQCVLLAVDITHCKCEGPLGAPHSAWYGKGCHNVFLAVHIKPLTSSEIHITMDVL